jgi:hypothetical protein
MFHRGIVTVVLAVHCSKCFHGPCLDSSGDSGEAER